MNMVVDCHGTEVTITHGRPFAGCGQFMARVQDGDAGARSLIAFRFGHDGALAGVDDSGRLYIGARTEWPWTGWGPMCSPIEILGTKPDPDRPGRYVVTDRQIRDPRPCGAIVPAPAPVVDACSYRGQEIAHQCGLYWDARIDADGRVFTEAGPNQFASGWGLNWRGQVLPHAALTRTTISAEAWVHDFAALRYVGPETVWRDMGGYALPESWFEIYMAATRELADEIRGRLANHNGERR